MVRFSGLEIKPYSQLTELPDVWEKKKEIESAIFKARQEEKYERKRKDAGYLETPARPV